MTFADKKDLERVVRGMMQQLEKLTSSVVDVVDVLKEIRDRLPEPGHEPLIDWGEDGPFMLHPGDIKEDTADDKMQRLFKEDS
jgi:hypothetical protein